MPEMTPVELLTSKMSQAPALEYSRAETAVSLKPVLADA